MGCVFPAWCLPCTVTYPDYGPLSLLVQVGVFVSLVSTKIPFKGAGKEYIGAASLGIRALGLRRGPSFARFRWDSCPPRLLHSAQMMLTALNLDVCSG